MHVALVNDAFINFSALRPVYDNKKKRIAYVHNQNLCTFELHSGDSKSDIENALKLITYLRMVIYVDGCAIRDLLTAKSTSNNFIYDSLPKLPTQGIPSRTNNTRFTPKKKRKYEVL